MLCLRIKRKRQYSHILVRVYGSAHSVSWKGTADTSCRRILENTIGNSRQWLLCSLQTLTMSWLREARTDCCFLYSFRSLINCNYSLDRRPSSLWRSSTRLARYPTLRNLESMTAISPLTVQYTE